MLGAETLMKCAFCTTDTEYKAYALYQVLPVYLAHAYILMLLTMPAYGTLATLIHTLLQRPTASTDELRPVRTRAHLRGIALLALAVLLALDMARMCLATDIPVQGVWQHVRTIH